MLLNIASITYLNPDYSHKYSIIVTEFAKRGLPHTSDLQASTIHNLRFVKAMDLEIVQFRLLA